ncbi:MAG: transmembrane 220 family protein [Verrucomicrobiota bacterium]
MKSPPNICRVVNLACLLLFAAFAWLQREDDNPVIYEDPSMLDVWIWVAFYALVAMAFGLAAAGKFPLPLYGVIAAFCLYQMVVTGPGIWTNLTGEQGFEMTKTSMAPQRAHVEQSREFFGAVIALAAVGFLWWQRSSASQNHKDPVENP